MERLDSLTESRASSQIWSVRAARSDLASGHTGGTFYIRARDRAGACVPAASETLVQWTRYGWLRGWPRGLSSSAVQIRMGPGCQPQAVLNHRPRGRVRHTRPRGSEEREKPQVRTAVNDGKTTNFGSRLWAPRVGVSSQRAHKLDIGTRREDGDSVAHDPAAGPQGPPGPGVVEQDAGALAEPAAPWCMHACLHDHA